MKLADRERARRAAAGARALVMEITRGRGWRDPDEEPLGDVDRLLDIVEKLVAAVERLCNEEVQ
jgi:hypothetical protein